LRGIGICRAVKMNIKVASNQEIMRSSRSRRKKVFKIRNELRKRYIGAAFSSSGRRRTIDIVNG